MNNNMEFGVIGLGRMGGSLALQAVEKGIDVAGYDKGEVKGEYKRSDIKIKDSIKEMKEELTPPRKIFIYVPAGPVVDKVISELSGVLDNGDIIIDGGNSYWGILSAERGR